MPTGNRDVIGYYSLLRWTPDPLSGEAINAGLLLFAQDGSWSRFRRRAIKTRGSQIATPEQIGVAEDWIKSFETGAMAAGPLGLLGNPIGLDDVRNWVNESAGSLAFTKPSAALGQGLDEVWRDLSSRYLGRTTTPRSKATAAVERDVLVSQFVASCRRVPSLTGRVHRGEAVRGARLTHNLDVTIRENQVQAIAHAIPFANGTQAEVGERRAVLVEAALDLPTGVAMFGIYDQVPPDRQDLVEQTRLFFSERLDHRVELTQRTAFADLARGLSTSLLPQ